LARRKHSLPYNIAHMFFVREADTNSIGYNQMIFGYIRVSTAEQNNDLQRDRLEASSVDMIHEDIISGKTKDRPGLDRLLISLRPGDTVKVWKLDRLGRSIINLVTLLSQFEKNGVRLISLNDGIDTDQPMGKAMLTMAAIFAEIEHDNIKSRTKAGLAAARSRGRIGGRKPKLSEGQKKQIKVLMDAGTDNTDIQEMFNISKTTLYRALNEFKG